MIEDVTQRARSQRLVGAGVTALAIALIAGVVAGCGGGGSTTSGAATAPAGGATGSGSAQGTTTGTGTEGASPFGGSSAAKGHTVADVLDAVLASGDPSKACAQGDYVTEAYLKSAYGGEEGCVKAQTSGSAAKSVEIQGVVGGSQQEGTATVKVVPRGGVYDGEKITVSLVKVGDNWQIDSLKSNAPVGP